MRFRESQSNGSAPPVDNPEEDPAACMEFYSTCGVSLADLIPQVKAPEHGVLNNNHRNGV